MGDLHILAPNYMGNHFTNQGLSEIAGNRGFGVREAKQGSSLAVAQEESSKSSSQAKNKLRVSKAREFGTSKESIGF